MATVDEFWEFCTSLADGRTLTSQNQNQRFSLKPGEGETLMINPGRGGSARVITQKEAEAFWMHYIKSLSRHPASYNDITDNAAVLLSLVELYMRGRHGVGV